MYNCWWGIWLIANNLNTRSWSTYLRERKAHRLKSIGSSDEWLYERQEQENNGLQSWLSVQYGYTRDTNKVGSSLQMSGYWGLGPLISWYIDSDVYAVLWCLDMSYVSELSDWTTTCSVCLYLRTFTLWSCSFYCIYLLFASSVMFYILDIHVLCNTGEYPDDNTLPLHVDNNSDRPLPDQSDDTTHLLICCYRTAAVRKNSSEDIYT
jgi:hypothetical protein